MRLPSGGVTGRHPYGLFTRVITAELFAPVAIWNGTGLARVSLCGLEQAELAGAGDSGGAVLNTEFAVQRALVRLHGVQ
jgi:hypothetical protein